MFDFSWGSALLLVVVIAGLLILLRRFIRFLLPRPKAAEEDREWDRKIGDDHAGGPPA